MGKDPSHTRPACEALLRRVVKGNELYRLGDVIDLGNILSIETLRSVCVVDSDKLVGDIVIRENNLYRCNTAHKPNSKIGNTAKKAETINKNEESVCFDSCPCGI